MQIQPMEQKKSFLQNDNLLVCSMLVIYGVCILGLVGAAFFGLNQISHKKSASETATAAVISTEQAHATSTAIALATEQAQYEFIDRFDKDTQRWTTGNENNDYFIGALTIVGGVYSWDIQKVKQPFMYESDYARGSRVRNADIYIDTKITESTKSYTCSGMIVRESTEGIDGGAYIFKICNNSEYSIWFHKDNWINICKDTYAAVIRRTDWNRLAISLREDRFTFQINGQTVYTFTDDRQPTGNVAIYMETEGAPASIWFDNFGFQSR